MKMVKFEGRSTGVSSYRLKKTIPVMINPVQVVEVWRSTDNQSLIHTTLGGAPILVESSYEDVVAELERAVNEDI